MGAFFSLCVSRFPIPFFGGCRRNRTFFAFSLSPRESKSPRSRSRVYVLGFDKNSVSTTTIFFCIYILYNLKKPYKFLSLSFPFLLLLRRIPVKSPENTPTTKASNNRRTFQTTPRQPPKKKTERGELEGGKFCSLHPYTTIPQGKKALPPPALYGGGDFFCVGVGCRKKRRG